LLAFVLPFIEEKEREKDRLQNNKIGRKAKIVSAEILNVDMALRQYRVGRGSKRVKVTSRRRSNMFIDFASKACPPPPPYTARHRFNREEELSTGLTVDIIGESNPFDEKSGTAVRR